jgi:RNA polymerase sigma-70 factor (ECF subfamily)
MAVELAQPAVGGDGPGERFARFEALYRRYHPALVSTCFRQTNDHAAAEDIAHETLLRAYQHLDWLDVSHAWPWLKTVASRLVIDDTRKLGRIRPLDVEDESLVVDASAGAVADPTEERLLLSEALARLPDRQRRAIALRYIADYDLDEAAEALRIDHAAFKQLLFRARRRLRMEYRRITAGAAGIVLWPLAFLKRARRLAVRTKHGFGGSRIRSFVRPALELGAALVVVGTFVLSAPAGRPADPGGGSSIGGTSTASGRIHHVHGVAPAFDWGPWLRTGWVAARSQADAPTGDGGPVCAAPGTTQGAEQGVTTSVAETVGRLTGQPLDPGAGSQLPCETGETSPVNGSGSLPGVPVPPVSVGGAVGKVKAAGTAASGEAGSATNAAIGGSGGATPVTRQVTDLATSVTGQLTDEAAATGQQAGSSGSSTG